MAFAPQGRPSCPLIFDERVVPRGTPLILHILKTRVRARNVANEVAKRTSFKPLTRHGQAPKGQLDQGAKLIDLISHCLAL